MVSYTNTYNICCTVLVILQFVGLDKRWVKYILLTVEVIGIGILYIFLTYHAILCTALVFLMSATYPNKRVKVYTYIITVVIIFTSAKLNYKYGLCDMNKVIFTFSAASDYGRKLNVTMEPLTFEKAKNILLFFALPRCLCLGVFANIALTIAHMSKEMHIHQEKVEKNSKIDHIYLKSSL